MAATGSRPPGRQPRDGGHPGLAYTKITNGISSSELTSDSRIVSCAGTYRFETCSGEKIVSSTFDASYEAAWLVPHTSTLTVGNLDFTYHTYVTNDTPTTTPYRVTVIIEWVNGAIADRAEQLRAAPEPLLVAERVCEPEHPSVRRAVPTLLLRPGRGAASAPGHHGPAPRLLAIDFDSLAITLPGISANAQEEQTTQLNAATTLSGIQFMDSTGDRERRQHAGNLGSRRRGGNERGHGERWNVDEPDALRRLPSERRLLRSDRAHRVHPEWRPRESRDVGGCRRRGHVRMPDHGCA